MFSVLADFASQDSIGSSTVPLLCASRGTAPCAGGVQVGTNVGADSAAIKQVWKIKYSEKTLRSTKRS